MTAFSIEIREATRADIRKCEGAPDYLETSDDGTASVFVDGELIAVSDEYATAYLCPGTNAAPTKEVVEKFLAAGLEFYGEAIR
jgi:hypothetical protein